MGETKHMMDALFNPRSVAMIGATADSSKIGRDHSFVSGSIDNVTILITDNGCEVLTLGAGEKQ